MKRRADFQGARDGTLATLLEKVGSQPQIFGAYKKSAPMRNKNSVMEVSAALQSLKVQKAIY